MDSPNSTSSNSTINTLPVDPTVIFGPQRDSLYLVIPITIIYSLIFVIGLMGNTFTCIVIVRNKSMHTATNYYLFSLAISDLLLLVSGMPQEMWSIWSKWPYVFGNTFCVLRGLAAETSTNASVLTITLFTIERYLAICHPFVSHKMSKLSRATKHVILLWVVALGLALPQALQFGIKKANGVVMCLQITVIFEHSFEISTFVFFLAPMILITVLYAFIGLKLRETSIRKDQTSQIQKDLDKYPANTQKLRRRHSQSTRRVIKMLVAVVIAFFVCWAPFHAQRLVAIYGTTENHLAKSPIFLSVYYFLTYTSGIFYYMSTCINPIFYHIMSNKFRDAFKSTINTSCCGRKKAGNRCSYTAMAVIKNPTSSNSGNSLKHEPNTNHNTSRRYGKYGNSDSIKFIEQDHVCKPVTTPTSPKEEYIFKRKFKSKNVAIEKPTEEQTDEIKVNIIKIKDTNLYCRHRSNNFHEDQQIKESCARNECCKLNHESEHIPKITVNCKKSDSDLKEIKLNISKREKEYG